MQMINAIVIRHYDEYNFIYKHHMQFPTSAPNFRVPADPSDLAFPSPCFFPFGTHPVYSR